MLPSRHEPRRDETGPYARGVEHDPLQAALIRFVSDDQRPLVEFPTAVTALIKASRISASRTAYSAAVAASSAWTNRWILVTIMTRPFAFGEIWVPGAIRKPSCDQGARRGAFVFPWRRSTVVSLIDSRPSPGRVKR